MSTSSDSYWKTVNRMIQDEKLEFSKPISERNYLPVTILKFNDSEILKKGIRYALSNFQEISKLEYDFNNGQSTKTTFKQLEWAKIFIESGQSDHQSESPRNSSVLNAQSYVPIGKFILDCHALAQRKSIEFQILTDVNRKTLISTLFGNESMEEVVSSLADAKLDLEGPRTSCTQIIFDSADVTSAIDELIINVSDRTWSPWRIKSVYIQESLKHKIHDLLTPERLNATSSSPTSNNDKIQKSDELAKRFGGKLFGSDIGTVNLLLDVPLKYLPHPTENTFQRIPVAINFFRTTKEAIQLVKSDFDSNEKNLTTIWTENIELFYELAAELSASIVWSNSVGVFDRSMPLLNDELYSQQAKRFGILSKFHLFAISNNTFLQFQFDFNYKHEGKICCSCSPGCKRHKQISIYSIWKNLCKLNHIYSNELCYYYE